jgi:hypothetical protein
MFLWLCAIVMWKEYNDVFRWKHSIMQTKNWYTQFFSYHNNTNNHLKRYFLKCILFLHSCFLFLNKRRENCAEHINLWVWGCAWMWWGMALITSSILTPTLNPPSHGHHTTHTRIYVFSSSSRKSFIKENLLFFRKYCFSIKFDRKFSVSKDLNLWLVAFFDQGVDSWF